MPKPITPEPDHTLDLPAQPTPRTTGAMCHMTDPGGSVVAGYEVQGELGRGGMGVVYKARQKGLGRTVALKMILAGAHAGERERARFFAEAEAVARLQHPNIVQVYEVGERDGHPFISLEFVEGGNLEGRLRRAALAPREAAELVRTLALAVHAAHQRGIVHRDLKPANVLLTPDGVPKVADFGLAKQLDGPGGQTQSGAVMGTPCYMAPEQAAGRSKDVGPATDVYALGAILFEALTGRPPFRADSTMDTLIQVMEQLPPRPRAFNPGVDPALEAVCLKCLEKSAADRYPSAAALAEDLDAYLRGEAVVADRSTHLRMLRLLLRESRHTEVLTQWGRVWMCQATVFFLAMFGATVLQWRGVRALWPYGVGILITATGMVFSAWFFRFRGGKPLTLVERQMGQVFGFTAGAVGLTILINVLKGLRPMELFPLAVLQIGVGFGAFAVILGGSFYLMPLACALTAVLLALRPNLGPLVFGTVMAVGLFVPGWRFSRRRSL